VPRRDLEVVLSLRSQLDAVLRTKVEDPTAEFSDAARGLLGAVVAVLEAGEEAEHPGGSQRERHGAVHPPAVNAGGGGGSGGGQQPLPFARGQGGGRNGHGNGHGGRGGGRR